VKICRSKPPMHLHDINFLGAVKVSFPMIGFYMLVGLPKGISS
jgi:hypothetical protein